MQQQHMHSIVSGMVVAMTTTVVVSVTSCSEAFEEGTIPRSVSKSTPRVCAVELDDGGDAGGGKCGDMDGGECGGGA